MSKKVLFCKPSTEGFGALRIRAIYVYNQRYELCRVNIAAHSFSKHAGRWSYSHKYSGLMFEWKLSSHRIDRRIEAVTPLTVGVMELYSKSPGISHVSSCRFIKPAYKQSRRFSRSVQGSYTVGHLLSRH